MTSSDPESLEMESGDLRERLEQDAPLTLVDIREPRERDHVKLDDDHWIRMNELPDQWEHLEDDDGPVVLYCHHGVRSLRAAKHLREQGMEEVYSLRGGIDHWARHVDEELPTY